MYIYITIYKYNWIYKYINITVYGFLSDQFRLYSEEKEQEDI